MMKTQQQFAVDHRILHTGQWDRKHGYFASKRRRFVKLNTGFSGLFAGGDYAMYVASHPNGSTTLQQSVLMRAGNKPDLQNQIFVKVSEDDATSDFLHDLTTRRNCSPPLGRWF